MLEVSVGKRYKRLTMKKYAKKYASVIGAVNKLRGHVEEVETQEVFAPEEIEQTVEMKREVVEIVPEAPVEVAEIPAPPVKKEIKSETFEAKQKTKAIKKQPLKQEESKIVKKTTTKKSTSKGQNKVS